ncbi:hypothetical protein CUB19_gp75 [Stenotrophomonas phage CUB19]|nr:hypothetical protein CUB19_gp75 [Stenotrophomonas phage CUB19]
MNLEQIDTSTTAGKVRVMQLAAEGRRVVHRTKGNAQWWDCQEPNWGWQCSEYAIIAEPVGPEEVYMAVSSDDQVKAVVGTKEGKKEWGGFLVVRYIRADLAGDKA